MATKRKKKNGFLRGAALLLPFLLFAAAVFCFSLYLCDSVLEENAYFSLLVGGGRDASGTVVDTNFVPGEAPDVLRRIPGINYGQQWAILNVDWDGGGWELRNIPVFLGADKAILKVGAGMSFASTFPGEGERCIISSHVTRYFAQLEDTPAGAIVTLNTLYGTYTYRVVDRQTFKGTDRTYLSPSSDKNELILYTCYPRDNDGHRRTKRCALICEKLSGLEVTG